MIWFSFVLFMVKERVSAECENENKNYKPIFKKP